MYLLQEFYDAILLKTEAFKAAIANPKVRFFFKRVILHVAPPSLVPTAVPSLAVGAAATSHSTDQTITIGASVIAALILRKYEYSRRAVLYLPLIVCYLFMLQWWRAAALCAFARGRKRRELQFIVSMSKLRCFEI